MVYAENSIRISRIRKRDHMLEKNIMERMKSQMNQEEVKNKVDFIIYNNGHDDLNLQICNLFNFLNNNIHC